MCATDDSRRACSHAFGNPVKPPSLAVEGLTEPPATSSASLHEGSGIWFFGHCRATTVTIHAALLLLIWVSRLASKRSGPGRLYRANQIFRTNTC